MRFVSICVTKRCNFACRMCDIGLRNKKGSGLGQNWDTDQELSVDQWGQIINKLNPQKIHIQGAEPLLYSKIDELLSRIKTPERTILITTNGWYINDHLDALCGYCDNIAVSIDGMKATHDRIRGVKGAYDRAHKGLMLLHKAGKSTRVSFAITPDNVGDMMEVHDMIIQKQIGMVFNHYNFIASESCAGFPGVKPANLGYYDLSTIDVDKLYEAVEYCTYATFLPNLTTQEEIKRYYQEIPTGRSDEIKRCGIINAVLAGDRCSIAADGQFITEERCWFNQGFGNALDDVLPEDNVELKAFNDEIQEKGLPAPCQRLCCAGNCNL